MKVLTTADAYVIYSRKHQGFRCALNLWAKSMANARTYARYEVAGQIASRLNPGCDCVVLGVGMYVHNGDTAKMAAAGEDAEPVADDVPAAA